MPRMRMFACGPTGLDKRARLSETEAITFGERHAQRKAVNWSPADDHFQSQDLPRCLCSSRAHYVTLLY